MAADEADGQGDLLRRKRRIVDPAADQVDRYAGLLLQMGVDRTDRLHEGDVAQNIVKAHDIDVPLGCQPLLLHLGQDAPGFHVAEGEEPGDAAVQPGLQAKTHILLPLKFGVMDSCYQ